MAIQGEHTHHINLGETQLKMSSDPYTNQGTEDFEGKLQEAQNQLRELLAQTELMTQAEISLATIYLKSTEELMVLDSEARRLRASSDSAQRTEDAAINQRLATVEAENRRLRRELEDAESKLEAITSIERSIRQQDQ